MTKNYSIYQGLKRLILIPTFLLSLFLGLTFWFIPKVVEKEGKMALSLIVISGYVAFILSTILIVKIWGARSQEKRYIKRESDFNKIFQYFNKKLFFGRGITLESGKYGTYIQINLIPTKSRMDSNRNEDFRISSQQFYD